MKNIIGSSLIEVVVSLFLLTTVILGFDLMQGIAMHTNQSAIELSTAILQVHGMVERLKALGPYQGFTQQVTQWNQENKIVLPRSKGIVSGKYPHYVIELDWGEKQCIQKKL